MKTEDCFSPLCSARSQSLMDNDILHSAPALRSLGLDKINRRVRRECAKDTMINVK